MSSSCPGRRRAARVAAASAWLVGLPLLSWAGAHGESGAVHLRGAVLCLDPTSVQVRFVGVAAARQRQAGSLRPALNTALRQTLQAGRVRHQARASCRQHPAFTRVVVEVRYLNPRNYAGFGDPAYSYVLNVHVGVPNVSAGHALPGVGSAPPRNIYFASSWNDIHSEARTGQRVEAALTALGREQAGDLVRAWRQANP